MKPVYKYLDNIKEHIYLDVDGVPRWKKDGYHKRYLKDELVKPFKTFGGYYNLQVPKQRATVPFHHIVAVLSGLDFREEDKEIDHLDGNRANNSITNLRVVTRKINNRNRAKRCDNTSGVTGIHWSEYHQHYVIRRTIKGKRISRSKKTWEEALEVLEELRAINDGYTERHGK